MINSSVIHNIHSTNLYGTFVETGAGNGISALLMNVPGASQTVYKCIQPYSKELQKELYGDFGRSVSREFCQAVINKEYSLAQHIEIFNFICVSTWQVSNDPGAITHGWFGMYNHGVQVFLHFTMKGNENFSRQEQNILIADLGIKILSNIANGILIDKIVSDRFILDMAYQDNKPAYDLLFNSLNSSKSDYFIGFRNGHPIRFDELMRESKEIIMLKGSFNPVHHQHVKMLDATNELYPSAKRIFLVSLDRYDKPHIENQEVIDKIYRMRDLGHTIVFCKEIFFYKTFEMLFKYSNMFYFPIGYDTMNRIYKTDFENNGCVGTDDFISRLSMFFKNFKLILFPRKDVELTSEYYLYGDMVRVVPFEQYNDDGTSSTKIRNHEIKNLLDEQNS